MGLLLSSLVIRSTMVCGCSVEPILHTMDYDSFVLHFGLTLCYIISLLCSITKYVLFFFCFFNAVFGVNMLVRYVFVYLCASVCDGIRLTVVSNVTKKKICIQMEKECETNTLCTRQMTTISFLIYYMPHESRTNCKWNEMKFISVESIYFSTVYRDISQTCIHCNIQTWNFVWNCNHAKICCQISCKEKRNRIKEMSDRKKK